MKAYHIPAAPAGTRWQRTQDDAKASARANGPWSAIDIPTDQQGLLRFINELEQKAEKRPGKEVTDAAGEASIGPAVPPPEPAAEASPSPPPSGSLTDTISTLNGAELIRVIEAAVCRLGEDGAAAGEARVELLRSALVAHPHRNAFYRGCARLNEVAAYTP